MEVIKKKTRSLQRRSGLKNLRNPRRLKSQVVRDAAEEELKEILDQLKTIIRNLYFCRFNYGESIMRVKPSLYIVHLMYSGSFLIVRCNNRHKLRVGGVFFALP